MITAIVTIKLPAGLTREKWLEGTKKIAGNFRDVPGLIRKNFLFSEEGVGGGIYTWQSREAADALYAGPWRDNIVNTFGVEPEIRFFDSPIIVDNELGEVKVAA